MGTASPASTWPITIPTLRRPRRDMDALDRLNWSVGLALVRYGVRVGVRASEPALLDGVADYLPPGARPCRAQSVDCLLSLRLFSPTETALYANGELLERTTDRRVILAALESAARFAIASRTRQRLFVHAGVVGYGGQAIVLPGPSGAGKSRLVEALVRAGGVYYSDEFAIFDAAGQVHPYPAPLRIGLAAGQLKARRPVETLPGVAGKTAIPVGLVVETRYVRGARWRPRRLSSGEAVVALLAHTVPARRTPKAALSILDRVIAGARALRGRRGEAERVAASLLDEVSRSIEA